MPGDVVERGALHQGAGDRVERRCHGGAAARGEVKQVHACRIVFRPGVGAVGVIEDDLCGGHDAQYCTDHFQRNVLKVAHTLTSLCAGSNLPL